MKDKTTGKTGKGSASKLNLSGIVNVASALLFIVFGVLMIANADLFVTVLFYAAGVLLAAAGIFSVIHFVLLKDRRVIDYMFIIYGAVSVALSVLFFMRVDLLLMIMSVFAGLFILIMSVIKLYQAIIFRKTSGVNVVAQIILAALGAICGILCILGRIIVPNVIMVFIGVVILVQGVLSLALTLLDLIQRMNYRKKCKKAGASAGSGEPVVTEDYEYIEEDDSNT